MLTSSREAWAPTAGFLVVGASAFALLAAGPRLLGPVDYSGLAIAWTVATIFGFGLAVPAEQVATRHFASGLHDRWTGGRTRTLLLLAATPIAGALVLSLAGTAVAGISDSVWWASALLAALGWGLLVIPRSRLAGYGDFTGYAAVLASEGGSRLLLVAASFVVPEGFREAALAISVGAPTFVAALVASSLGRRRTALSAVPGAAGPKVPGELAALVAVAVAMQVLLNSAPLWLSASSGAAAATAGIFVSVTSYMRIPALATGGAMTVVLARTSAASYPNASRLAKDVLLAHLRPVLVVTGGASLLLVALSPVGLRLLYGTSLDIGVVVLTLIGVTTVSFGLANIATQTLLGMGRTHSAAGIWILAALCATLLLALLPATVAAASFGIFVGVVAGACGVAWALRSMLAGPDLRGTSGQ